MSYRKKQASTPIGSLALYQLIFLIAQQCLTPPHAIRESLLGLAEDAAGHVALAQVVLDSALLGGGGLCEGSGATEGTGQSGVLHADDADVLGAADGTLASHTLGHLDLYMC